MSDKKNDGGPAFPVPMIPCDSHGAYTGVESGGMTLRDYFAAKAMQAIVGTYYDTLRAAPDELEGGNGTDYTTFSRELAIDQNARTGENDGAAEIAKDSYMIADAMLAARGGAA